MRGHVDGQEIDSGPLARTGDVTRSFTHTFPDDGTYTVLSHLHQQCGTLTVSTSWTVEVGDSTEPANRAPSVTRVSPSSSSRFTLTTGASQTFTAQRHRRRTADITSYEWTVNGRGSGQLGHPYAHWRGLADVQPHPFSDTGTYTVKATFTDDEGASGSVSWTVEGRSAARSRLQNSAPSRYPSSAPVSPVHDLARRVGDARTFTARATDDDNNLTKWKWDVDKQRQTLSTVTMSRRRCHCSQHRAHPQELLLTPSRMTAPTR